jgi:hypothetical protein
MFLLAAAEWEPKATGGKQGKKSSPEFVNNNATGHFLLKQLHLKEPQKYQYSSK